MEKNYLSEKPEHINNMRLAGQTHNSSFTLDIL